MAELSVGRHARRSAVGSVRKMAFDAGAPGLWAVAGWVSMIAGVLILCFYSVVAGWVIAYVFKMGAGEFVGADPEAVSASFSALTSNTNVVIGWHSAFMLATVSIVALGVTKGIERSVTILMPLFFLTLIGLVIYAALYRGHGCGSGLPVHAGTSPKSGRKLSLRRAGPGLLLHRCRRRDHDHLWLLSAPKR